MLSSIFSFLKSIPAIMKVVGWFQTAWDNHQDARIDGHFKKIDQHRDIIYKRIERAKTDEERAELLKRLHSSK